MAARIRKMDQREHVLTRPGMYVGSVVPDKWTTHVYDSAAGRMMKRELTVVPALYKIFDEVLVNAIDHATRLATAAAGAAGADVQRLRNIKVTIDRTSGRIDVVNDGDGLQVERDAEHGLWVPELTFGHLLTSSNYDDTEERVVGGQNGIGAKACNIFSKWFEIETVDHRRKKVYTQAWYDNMSRRNEPTVRACAKKAYTRVSFIPDYARFGATGLSDDMVALFEKRCYDACALTEPGVSVWLNGVKIECKTFERYVDLYLGPKAEHPRVHERVGERWEVVASYNDALGFEQVSFVNGMWTVRGGKHVDHVASQVCSRLAEVIEKRRKGVGASAIKPAHVKSHLMLFVKGLVTNPTFDSQTKDLLTTPASRFGSKLDLSDAFVEKLYKTGIVDHALSLSGASEEKALKKSDGKKTGTVRGIVKLDDATWAGTTRSAECTLILTEGDSAKAMALSGIEVVGRERYGVFPLRGKLLNVKDVAASRLAANEEITTLKKILGLESGRDYDKEAASGAWPLRYGRIMVMTDADSVTGDTPLLLRDAVTGTIEVRTIDDISITDWVTYTPGTEKEYSTTAYEVWTEKGWTRIKHVMRHKTSKRIFRVLTHTGCVDVTEDHSLLDKDCNEVTPSACEVGQELLHSFPQFKDQLPLVPANLEMMHVRELHKVASHLHVQRYQEKRKDELLHLIYEKTNTPTVDIASTDDVSVEEAWAMGLFWADGTCGIYMWDRPHPYTFNRTSYTWAISNTNTAYLEKAKVLLESQYEELDFKIIEDHTSHASDPTHHVPVYKLIINGGIKTAGIVQPYRELFYDANKKKRVPSLILNASEAVRRAFFDGFYAGDGNKGKGGVLNFDVDGKVGAMGMFFLCRSLGYLASLNIRLDKPKVYTINLTPPESHQQLNPNVIKKIFDLGISEQYVYDLETENHHFHAGVGQMIVHNTDGSHIKGLLFNLFQTLWPSLFARPGFMCSLLTPIVKARKGRDELQFYNMTDYDNWVQERRGEGGLGSWDIKYYKGLATSKDDEARGYFKDMRCVEYVHTSDGGASSAAIDLAFNKKRADDRKEWLGGYDRQAVLVYNGAKGEPSRVPYEDFVHRELIHFSNYDVERSIPSAIDGLKISQRKVLYGCFKRNLTSEVRVAQLAAYVSEHTAYHHGEASLQATIVGMAQEFVGSNNINLLMPNGQFGTRVQGGKNAGSPRYIYTQLSEAAFKLFRKDDAPVLRYTQDDGQFVEPEWYAPILPMVLVNGALGIGTGFSTSVPCYNPKDVAAAVRLVLSCNSVTGEDDFGLVPWYRGFTGVIDVAPRGRGWVSRGRWERVAGAPAKVRVTELPVGTWTEDYKEFLEGLLDKGDIKSYESNYYNDTVDFTVVFHSAERLDALLLPAPVSSGGRGKRAPVCSVGEGDEDEAAAEGRPQIEAFLKLASTKNLGVNNMYLFNARGQIKKYSGPGEIVREFVDARLEVYGARKAHQLAALEADERLVSERVRFLEAVIAGDIAISKLNRVALEERLDELSFPRLSAGSGVGKEPSYDYLVRMPIYNLTPDKKKELEEELASIRRTATELRSTTLQTIWHRELDELMVCLERLDCAHAKRRANGVQPAQAASKPVRKVRTAVRA